MKPWWYYLIPLIGAVPFIWALLLPVRRWVTRRVKKLP